MPPINRKVQNKAPAKKVSTKTSVKESKRIVGIAVEYTSMEATTSVMRILYLLTDAGALPPIITKPNGDIVISVPFDDMQGSVSSVEWAQHQLERAAKYNFKIRVQEE